MCTTVDLIDWPSPSQKIWTLCFELKIMFRQWLSTYKMILPCCWYRCQVCLMALLCLLILSWTSIALWYYSHTNNFRKLSMIFLYKICSKSKLINSFSLISWVIPSMSSTNPSWIVGMGHQSFSLPKSSLIYHTIHSEIFWIILDNLAPFLVR